MIDLVNGKPLIDKDDDRYALVDMPAKVLYRSFKLVCYESPGNRIIFKVGRQDPACTPAVYSVRYFFDTDLFFIAAGLPVIHHGREGCGTALVFFLGIKRHAGYDLRVLRGGIMWRARA